MSIIKRQNYHRFLRTFLFTALIVFIISTPSLSILAVQSGVDRRVVARAEAFTKDKFKYGVQTPRGARVVSVSEPSRAALEAVDQGLTTLFEVARRRGYKARLRYQDYIIFIARADRTKDKSGAYSPDIALPAGQYVNSSYDQGGFVYAAGFVLAYTTCGANRRRA
ncbi:MAG: hypothetical protein WKF84_11540 [Pyrinomonadaceae bacterium]